MIDMLDLEYLTEIACDPRTDVRVALAGQLAELSIDPGTPPAEAEAILPLMMRLGDDTVFAVRSALVSPLVSDARTPRKLLFAMIGDVEEISLPLLATSPVFAERDLIAIVRRADPPRQGAIAVRFDLTAPVCDTLIELAPEPVCIALLENTSAPISFTGLRALANRFETSEPIRHALLARHDLPVSVRVAMMCAMADDREILLTEREGEAREPDQAVINDPADLALLSLAMTLSASDLGELVRTLHDRDRLTIALIAQAACRGQMSFVEMSLGFIARMPAGRARSLLNASWELGWSALARRCRLPQAVADVIRLAALTRQDTRCNAENWDAYGAAMIERLMTDVEIGRRAGQVQVLELMRDFAEPQARVLAIRLLNAMNSRAA